ncbi:MAG TPA: DUF5615 family PIN-like protein [Tepidisphaeraceae bacterium]|nr:DUF5615 family PIN-like protein [Tepidisphaeraceae bacterium]
MNIKLDENLGERCVDLLRGAGHDVATVYSQSMCAADDVSLIAMCRDEQRVLISLDLDFANPLIFPPRDYHGIAVLRLPRRPTLDDLHAAVATLIAMLERESIVGQLWTVERGRVRVYQDPDAPIP